MSCIIFHDWTFLVGMCGEVLKRIANSIKNMKQEMIGSERPDQALMCVQFILYTWRLGLSSKVKSSYLVITIEKLLSSKQHIISE